MKKHAERNTIIYLTRILVILNQMNVAKNEYSKKVNTVSYRFFCFLGIAEYDFNNMKNTMQ